MFTEANIAYFDPAMAAPRPGRRDARRVASASSIESSVRSASVPFIRVGSVQVGDAVGEQMDVGVYDIAPDARTTPSALRSSSPPQRRGVGAYVAWHPVCVWAKESHPERPPRKKTPRF
jgi:hypothetical protein